MKLALPVYLDDEVRSGLTSLAEAKGVDVSELVNDLLGKALIIVSATPRDAERPPLLSRWSVGARTRDWPE